MIIATWNVNSIRAREDRFLDWLENTSPDILCLQEIKATADTFPFHWLTLSGYQAVIHGQKKSNGVAILAREKPTDVEIGFDDDVEDDSARFIAATVAGIRVLNAYVPTGWPIGSEYYQYKIDWMSRLMRYVQRHDLIGQDAVLCGDFNIAPTLEDINMQDQWEGTSITNPDMRKLFGELVDLGFTESFRQHHRDQIEYSWWDAMDGSFGRNNGMRIDHILLTPSLAARCTGSLIDRQERTRVETSDHAPVLAILDQQPEASLTDRSLKDAALEQQAKEKGQTPSSPTAEMATGGSDEPASRDPAPQLPPATTTPAEQAPAVSVVEGATEPGESATTEQTGSPDGAADTFVHLHCHSHYSLLNGACRIGDLIDRAKQLGMPAIALTDNGNLFGALQFYEKALFAGIKPILGYEANVAPESRFKKDSGGLRKSSFRLTLLAQDERGFKNLIKLASKAYLEGFYYKPRIDKELLRQHSDGIICLSGDGLSEFSQAIAQNGLNNLGPAKQIASWYADTFPGRYYIELMNHELPHQQELFQGAVQVAQELKLPIVATSDVHYIHREDHPSQDVLMCIGSGKFRTDASRFRLETDQFYLRSPAEMQQAFADYPEAISNTAKIADSVDIQLALGERYFPTFPLPEGKTAADYLRELCLDGLKKRYANSEQRMPGGELAEDVLERLERELYVINTLGFPNYFLIVWDFVHFAKENNIQCTTRGSGVGSLVSYALYLSHVCPLEYDLLFERFLDISRKEAPDIDIDFEKERRGEVIQYVKDKYGEANVAQIGTFGTLAARAAIRDVGRALGLPIFRVDMIVSKVPDTLGISLDEALQVSDELKQLYDNDEEVRELLDLARSLEGLARNVGTHAAAVVIADRPLEEYVPLQRVTGKEETITQWSMNDVESAGLLKMDFLGLRNLTMLSKAVQLIESNRGEKIDPYAFPLTDSQTYALLCRGETKGVFQLESGGIRDLLQRMKPDRFRDIIATNALYRPGPLEGGMVDDYIEVKHGRKSPQYLHPVMEDILSETHGVMVYQEQVMRILNRLGGIELSDAYKCIKAISKKKLPIIAKYKEDFITGATNQGLREKQADDLFGLIEKFAGYGFNKSHSTAYALIAYMTAYLKAHYSVEFMASLLCSDIDGRNFKRKDALVEHLEDCQRMGISVVPPDVNSCYADFAVEGEDILFGLSAIKGCGAAAGEMIAQQRAEKGPYRDLFDFCERVDPSVVNRSTCESLIKAGAFDSLHEQRAPLMLALERALQAGVKASADRKSGQKSLFGEPEVAADDTSQANIPIAPEWEEKEKLGFEKEVLGFYLTSHPLAEHEAKLTTFCTHTTLQAAQLQHRSEVLIGGMLAALKFSHTKRPRTEGGPTKYVMFDLEDMVGTIRCIVWPEQFAECGHLAEADKIVAARGKIDKRPGSDEANLIVDELIPLDDLQSRYTKCVLIRLQEDTHGVQGVEQLHEILRGYPGDYRLRIYLQLLDNSVVQFEPDNLRIDLNPEMRRRTEELVGAGNFRLEANRPKTQPAPEKQYGNRRGSYASSS